MSVVGLDTHPVPVGSRVSHARWMVPTYCLEMLRDRVEMSVLGSTEGLTDPLLREGIEAALEAFLRHDGDPRAASAQVAPYFERIGERQARLGEDVSTLCEHFQRARIATQRGLRDALGVALVGRSMVQLREALMTYLDALHHHARVGMERGLQARAAGDDNCRGRLTDALFNQADEMSLTRLAKSVGLIKNEYVPVISIGGPLPSALLARPEVLHRAAGTEAVVPASWLEEHSMATPQAQVVTGPSVRLASLPEAISLTRRAADLLSRQVAFDPRPVVPCSDLLGLLLVDANPVLVNLLVAKHLGIFEDMAPKRRAKLVGTLLHWLQRGLPANQLARELDLPTQTVHSRLKVCREMFADVLDDPIQRLELIVALRATVPQWTAPTDPAG